jgi:hypothetical protein
MSGLVFIHGIGGIRHDDVEIAAFRNALVDGARAAGHPHTADVLAAGDGPPIRFANYSDLFHTVGGQGYGHSPGALETEIMSDILAEYIDIQLKLDHDDPVTVRRLEDARLQLDSTRMGQGVIDPFRRIMNAVTTLLSVPPLRAGGQWLTAKVMLGDLSQVARYLARSEVDAAGRVLDERIRIRLVEQLAMGPTIVVAHSLGTVVALETLHSWSGQEVMFVTLGSPIALRAAVLPRLVPHPPRTPELVSRWLNYWDRDDIVAARPILEETVRANTAGVRPTSHRVDSDGLWVHSVVKYLRQPGVAGQIVACLWENIPHD